MSSGQYLAVVHNMQRAVQWRESDVGWPVKLHRVGLKSIEACYYEWPIRGQHSGHVISMDQSEARQGSSITVRIRLALE